MSLTATLDTMRNKAASQIPEPARQLMQRATQDLIASGAADKVVSTGQPLPAFDLQNQYGDGVNSTALLARGPLVLTVYRGLW